MSFSILEVNQALDELDGWITHNGWAGYDPFPDLCHLVPVFRIQAIAEFCL